MTFERDEKNNSPDKERHANGSDHGTKSHPSELKPHDSANLLTEAIDSLKKTVHLSPKQDQNKSWLNEIFRGAAHTEQDAVNRLINEVLDGLTSKEWKNLDLSGKNNSRGKELCPPRDDKSKEKSELSSKDSKEKNKSADPPKDGKQVEEPNFPVSRLERFGNWAQVVMTYARDISVMPAEQGKVNGAQLILKADGTLVRPDKKYLTDGLTPEKICPPEVQIRYEGCSLNDEQLKTLKEVRDYAREKGMHMSFDHEPWIALHPLLNLDLAEKSSGSAKKYLPPAGTVLLPEGVPSPERVAQAVQLAQMDAGFNIDVTSALRTREEQEYLYKKLADKQSVALPGSSYHDPARGAIAIDVDNWKQSKPYLERHGFIHGDPGRRHLWNDPFHFVFIYEDRKYS